MYEQVLYQNFELENLKEEVYNKFRELSIEPPTLEQINRLTKSAIQTYENKFFQETFRRLSVTTRVQMDNLIDKLDSYEHSEIEFKNEEESISLNDLRSSPEGKGLDAVLMEVNKLRTIKQIHLPENLFTKIPQKILKKYKHQVLTEDLTELRRHPEQVRYTLQAIFFGLQQGNYR